MGYALAEAAAAAGHHVTLISGPVALPAPPGVTFVAVETAHQMFEAVRARIAAQDAAVFSAAVADYRPVTVAAQKIKKTGAHLALELERTEDTLGAARSAFGFNGFLVGFAAETENVIENAQEKLRKKRCDLIVANDVSKAGIGFDSAENEVTLCLPGGEVLFWPRQLKAVLARELIGLIAERAAAKNNPHPPL